MAKCSEGLKPSDLEKILYHKIFWRQNPEKKIWEFLVRFKCHFIGKGSHEEKNIDPVYFYHWDLKYLAINSSFLNVLYFYVKGRETKKDFFHPLVMDFLQHFPNTHGSWGRTGLQSGARVCSRGAKYPAIACCLAGLPEQAAGAGSRALRGVGIPRARASSEFPSRMVISPSCHYAALASARDFLPRIPESFVVVVEPLIQVPLLLLHLQFVSECSECSELYPSS